MHKLTSYVTGTEQIVHIIPRLEPYQALVYCRLLPQNKYSQTCWISLSPDSTACNNVYM